MRNSISTKINFRAKFLLSSLLLLYVPMYILDMTPWSLRTALTPNTVKIKKKNLKLPTKWYASHCKLVDPVLRHRVTDFQYSKKNLSKKPHLYLKGWIEAVNKVFYKISFALQQPGISHDTIRRNNLEHLSGDISGCFYGIF